MELTEKKKNRTAAKKRLTLISNKIRDLDVTSTSKQEIVLLIDNFEQRLSTLDSIQQDVESSISDDIELEAEIENSEHFRDEKLVHLIKVRELLDTRNAKDKESASSASTHSESGFSTNNQHQQARLPQIELPKFDGDHTQWQPFWDKFSAIVHNSSLPPVSKFTYLQALLSGEALQSISGLALTDANYETAREILGKRFGRRERIVAGHIQQLLGLTNPGRNISDLWTLHDKLQTHIRSLENLDITGDAYGVILTPIVLFKLPEYVRMEWARNSEGKESNLEALLSFLHSEIVRRERAQTFKNETTPPSSFQFLQKGRPSTASALHAQSASLDRCGVCGKGHTTSKCYSWSSLDLSGRKSQCISKGLCFLCLAAHRIKDCPEIEKGSCHRCSGKHHPFLCRGMNRTASTIHSHSTNNNNSSGSGEAQTILQVNSSHTGQRCAMLQMARVTPVMNENMKLNILFDSGADRSYISESCAKALGLTSIGKDSISVALFGQGKPGAPKLRDKYSLKLKVSPNNGEELIVTETPMICAPIKRTKIPAGIFRGLMGQNLNLAQGSLVDSDIHVNIDVLVGVDQYWKFVTPNVSRVTEYLSAQETKFGWILSGSWEQADEQCSPLTTAHQLLCMTDIPDNFGSQLWDLDVIGVEDSSKGDGNSQIDSRVLERFRQSVSFDKGRYEVSLPWKDDQKDRLVDNKVLALARADSLKRRLSKSPALEEDYNHVLSDLEERGIIHVVPPAELLSAKPAFYLPHRPVIRASSATTKIRPVFDASAKGSNGISVNDCVEAGPNLTPNLIEVMLRFRRWKYGLTADIEKAFLQIRVAKEDQDVHRFIWDVRGQRKIMRFDRVIFGNASSPFLLNATIRHHLNDFHDCRVVSELAQNLYVDDWLSGADTEEEVESMMVSATEIMSKGSFPLSKWGSNSSAAVPQKAVKGFHTQNEDEVTPCLKVLGMYWETNDDVFCFRSDNVLLEGVQYTKRLVLSFIARIFDPMGFLNPFSVLIKIMFQELWRLGLQWDDPLPEEHQRQMSIWASGFKDISEWKIPRRVSVQSWNGSSHKKLFCFSDASEKAFGCCVYLGVYENGVEKLSLVASRVRVAPLKRVTLPRLELLGAVLAARMLCFVQNALKLPMDTPYLCLTDSTIVLHWIKADPSRWKPFVRNRITEIQSCTSPSNWRHISGKKNPADLLTRGVCATELTNSSEWLRGPADLEFGQVDQNLDLEAEGEIRDEKAKGDIALLSVQSQQACEPIVEFERFSTLSKIIKVVGWVLRFVKNLKSSITKAKEPSKNRCLTSCELDAAKVRVMNMVQRERFQEEIDCLKGGSLVSKGSALYKMSPVLDEHGLIRVGGRLQMSRELSFDEKHPIILPKCHVSLLFVRFQHQVLKHGGVSVLISSLRSNYCIFGLRGLAKKVCRECVPCQRQNSRACKQIMAPLPSDRITRSHPFAVTGLDHAGPVYCEDTGNKKHYILLLTCGVTRAVHLELVPSLSLPDFMFAFRKFVARRGIPSTIYSDNAKTFTAASTSLVSQFGPVAPSWRFSIPLAPWYGGWWERLVRSTKSALRKSLGCELVSRPELEVILTEVEASLNSRPLTFVGDTCEVLTPSHFLLSRSSAYSNVQTGTIPQNSYEFGLLDLERKATLGYFWNVWSEEYIRNLPSLGNGKSTVDLQEGSLVLIRGEGSSRLKWPMGKVIKIIPSKDGLVRAVRIKTDKGELVRAVQKLHKLEVLDSAELYEETETPTPNQIKETSDSEKDRVVSSKSGRTIRPPKVLDL